MTKQITNITARRESITLPINNNEETWTYLSLYDQDDELVVRSGHHHPEGNIHLEYNGLVFVSLNNHEVYVTFESLKTVVQ
jgi:hypothetical protein